MMLPNPTTGAEVKPQDLPEPTVQQRIQALEAEVLAIQKSQERSRLIGWLTDFTVIAGVVTFILSLITTAYSFNQTRIQDRHNARVELRGLLQRITEINRETLSATEGMAASNASPDDAEKQKLSYGFGMLSALQAENVLLADQAAYLIRYDLDGEVTASEYTTVGFAYQSSGLNQEALDLFLEAEKRIANLNDSIVVYRSLAGLYFLNSSPEMGRQYYQKANEVFTRFPHQNPYYVEQVYYQTELTWANSEYIVRACDEAKTHYNKAMEHARLLAVPGVPNVYENQLAGVRGVLELCQPGQALTPRVPVTAPRQATRLSLVGYLRVMLATLIPLR